MLKYWPSLVLAKQKSRRFNAYGFFVSPWEEWKEYFFMNTRSLWPFYYNIALEGALYFRRIRFRLPRSKVFLLRR